MNVRLVKGKPEVQMLKADARVLVEARYLLDFLHRNGSDDNVKKIAENAATLLRVVVATHAGKYVDDDGDLLETPQEAAVNASAPSNLPGQKTIPMEDIA